MSRRRSRPRHRGRSRSAAADRYQRLPAAAAHPTAAAAAPGRPVLARPRLVDVQLAALEIAAVQTADRGLRLRPFRHLKEAEALGFAGDPVLDDGAGGHLAELLECLL